MATKKKGRNQNSPNQLFERAQRELAKGDVKNALKDAKVCFRAAGTAQHRQLLEQAYAARVEQLHRQRLTAEAKTLLNELIAFKPADSAVQQQAVRLRALLGDASEDTARLLESDPALLIRMVDEAILDPRCAIPNRDELRTHVGQLRQALAAIEQGNDDAAAALLQSISRNSPLADWKLFCRGLMAFYQADRERTDDNWRRLDRNRPASRIARTLLLAANESTEPQPSVEMQAAARWLLSKAQQQPVGEVLFRLARHWSERDWNAQLRDIQTLQQRFGKSHPELLDQVLDLVWKEVVHRRDDRRLSQLMHCGAAPILDPRWNRAQALMHEAWDRPDVSPVQDFWEAYIRDLGKLAALSEVERPRAIGIVYRHLAREFVMFARSCPPPLPESVGKSDMEEFYDQADRYYRKAIENCPQLISAYHEFAQLHDEHGHVKQAESLYKKLLKVQPLDYDANLWLANYYLDQDAPEESAPFVAAVNRVKPRDGRTGLLRWSQKTTAIRILVKKRKYDEARQQLNELVGYNLSIAPRHVIGTIRAALEFKAKNEKAARAALAEAVAALEEPTAVWQQMTVLAARYSLPAALKKEFSDKYKADIRRDPQSQTAGLLASYFAVYRQASKNYTGRATQERLFFEYLHRAINTDIHWQANDLLSVCLGLRDLPQQSHRYRLLVNQAVDEFPDHAHFQLLAGQILMDVPPWRCDVHQAMKHMKQAVKLARGSGMAHENEIVSSAEKALTLLQNLGQRWGGASIMDDVDFDDDLYEDDDDKYEDGEYDDASEFFGMPLPPPFTGNMQPLEGLDIKTMLEEDPDIAKAMLDTMPRELKRQVEQIAKMTGKSPLEIVKAIVAGDLSGLKPEGEDERPQGRRKR